MLSLTTLITLLILGLVLYLVWYAVGLAITGRPHQIIGVILALIFLIYALHLFGIF